MRLSCVALSLSLLIYMSLYGIFYASFYTMRKNDLRTRNDRHSRLLGLLRSDEHWTTKRLADELEVSPRTLLRDLAELRDTGYPVEADRGRGGGVRLNGRWGIERLNLTNQEAISLLLSLTVTEALAIKSTDFGSRGLKQKIANAFPTGQRRIINELRKRILISPLASNAVLENFQRAEKEVWDNAVNSFFDSRRIRLCYVHEKGNTTERDFDPHFLMLSWPVWYLLGWDYLRATVRVFRIDRIRRLTVLNDAIVRRPPAVFLESHEAFFRYL